MGYREFEYVDRVYVVPVNTQFEAIEKQPSPDIDAVLALNVGEVTLCKYFVGYVPSSLLLPHHHIVCAFPKPIAPL
jgi:hypothetical protein